MKVRAAFLICVAFMHAKITGTDASSDCITDGSETDPEVICDTTRLKAYKIPSDLKGYESERVFQSIADCRRCMSREPSDQEVFALDGVSEQERPGHRSVKRVYPEGLGNDYLMHKRNYPYYQDSEDARSFHEALFSDDPYVTLLADLRLEAVNTLLNALVLRVYGLIPHVLRCPWVPHHPHSLRRMLSFGDTPLGRDTFGQKGYHE